MVYTEKGAVENFFIKELRKLGWTYINPGNMKEKRRGDFEEPLVVEGLKTNLKRINNVELADADLDFIIVSLRTIPASIDGIKKFLFYLRNGLVVPLEKENKERVIKLIDFENVENNEFVVTNQFKVEGLRGSIGTREDVILLVNGIPLVLIECKSPVREEVSWLDAYKQIKRYEEQAPDLFKYVQFSIATDGIKTYYFPNAFNEEGKDFMSIWKDSYPYKKSGFKDDLLKITIYGLLSRPNLFDLVENFIFVRKEKGALTKVMTRYMQFRASSKIFRRVINTLKGKETGKFGLIWHWQGSGKTYTMAFSAWKLLHCPEAENPSIFVMVDRKELEEQIEKDFSFLEIPIERVHSIKKLIEILKWGREGKRG
ncbi:MAG: HsdR family type I site-specific deoxyribonuclease, partial [Candidatus Helarchaeota archaeon]|nr:HsdR family type I site-specific deoxyribonuclease [Candidatus Helarchaeota archaeon]